MLLPPSLFPQGTKVEDYVRSCRSLGKQYGVSDFLIEKTVTALECGQILPGPMAIRDSKIPSVLTTGSYDPPHYGHAFLLRQTQQQFPGIPVVLVLNTRKKLPPLLPLIVRVPLLYSYEVDAPMILGEDVDDDRTFQLLTTLHSTPRTIVKGRRSEDDSQANHGLIMKYSLPDTVQFVEIDAPPELQGISSSGVRGILEQSRNPESISAMVNDAVRNVLARCCCAD